MLGRAVISAAPAGLLIWVLANVPLSGQTTLLTALTGFLDPFARRLGMDGCILTGFLLGLPANEIVVPIIIMTYMARGSLLEVEGVQLMQLFTANGWTWITAVSTLLFFPDALALRHHPPYDPQGIGEPEMDAAFLSCTNCLRNYTLLPVHHHRPFSFSRLRGRCC